MPSNQPKPLPPKAVVSCIACNTTLDRLDWCSTCQGKPGEKFIGPFPKCEGPGSSKDHSKQSQAKPMEAGKQSEPVTEQTDELVKTNLACGGCPEPAAVILHSCCTCKINLKADKQSEPVTKQTDELGKTKEKADKQSGPVTKQTVGLPSSQPVLGELGKTEEKADEQSEPVTKQTKLVKTEESTHCDDDVWIGIFPGKAPFPANAAVKSEQEPYYWFMRESASEKQQQQQQQQQQAEPVKTEEKADDEQSEPVTKQTKPKDHSKQSQAKPVNDESFTLGVEHFVRARSLISHAMDQFSVAMQCFSVKQEDLDEAYLRCKQKMGE